MRLAGPLAQAASLLLLIGCSNPVETARQEGYDAGYEEGHSAGMEEGKHEGANDALDCVRNYDGPADEAADSCS